MKLQGVDLHATEGAVGSAVRYDALAHQMELMKSMGANALRTAHNPPAPELVAGLRAARHPDDGRGLRLLAHREAGRSTTTSTSTQWSDSDIKEMVNAAKNSPAVVLWSIGNETPDTGLPGGPAIAQKLIADIKVDRHHPAGGHGLGQVPQRAATLARRRT